MKTADTGTGFARYELRSELARRSLRAAEPDPDRRLAWANSVGLAFLLIGVVGLRPAASRLKPLPPPEAANVVLAEPLVPPPAPTSGPQTHEPAADPAPGHAHQVVVATPETPAIQFAVPTLGNLAVPSALAKAPPVRPLEPVSPLYDSFRVLATTGSGGERPQPPYPRLALDQGQQGTVSLRLVADETGSIRTVEVAQSSGFATLDRSALEFVKRHWTVPTGANRRTFEATIIYKLQMN